MRTNTKTLTLKTIVKHRNYYRNFIIASSAFLLAFISASILAPTTNSSAEQKILAEISDGTTGISVSGSGEINLLVNNPTDSGQLVTATDTLSIDAAQAPHGYQLYLSVDNNDANGNRLYQEGDPAKAYLTPNQFNGADVAFGNETALSANSWGFTNNQTKSANHQYSAVPLYGNAAKISEQNSAGTYNQNVYYAVKADTNMKGGLYAGTVVYTLVSEDVVPADGIKSVTPNEGGPGIEIQILVQLSAPAAEVSDLGTITTKIGSQDCQDPTYALTESSQGKKNQLTITCKVPVTEAGMVAVSVTTQRYGQVYTMEQGFKNKLTMQKFTNAMCNTLPISTAENPYYPTLEDERDGKTYKVSRLADNPTSGTGANNGICWMVQNLALNGTDSSTGQARVLTPSDSDVTTNRTLALDMTSGSSNATSVQIIPSVQNNTTTSCNTSSYPDCIVSSEPYGNLYNWYAATATTGTSSMTSQDATDSVCPKGWKLPVNSITMGSGATDRSYSKLMYSVLGVTSSGTNHSAVQNVQKAPLYFPLSGLYTSGLYNQGQYGYYWSRTAYSSSSNAYNLYFYSNYGYFYPQSSNAKYFGFAVRCVLAEQRTLADITYMQDINSDICQNTTEGFATTLLDRRGKGNSGSNKTTGYGVVKAKDGNCWMTDNLDLYNKTVSSTDTDLPSGSFTIPASSNWSSNIYNEAKVHIATKSGYAGQNYYNWCSAIGLSDCSTTAQQDQSICPKGWQLPINGGNTVDKSWAKLLNAYSVTSGSQLLDSSNAAYELGFRQYYGLWNYSGVYEDNQGSSANFWSSTPNSSTFAYNFSFLSSGVNPQYDFYKSFGFSVRCVARSS